MREIGPLFLPSAPERRRGALGGAVASLLEFVDVPNEL